MRILYITNRDDSYGGAQCLMELMENICKYDDVEVVFLNTRHNKFNKWCTERGIENYSVDYVGQMYSKHDTGIKFLAKYISYFLRYYFMNPFAIRKIEKTLDIKSFDYIHSNTAMIDVGMQLSRRNHVKHIYHLREFGKEDMNFIPFRSNCYKVMNKYGGRFIAISDVIKNSWIQKGISSRKITRIYDGIKASQFPGRESVFEGERVKVAFCGSITPFKDQEQLINAFVQMPKAERSGFIVDIWGAGKQSYVDGLKRKVKEKGLDDVIRFRGYSSNLYHELYNYDVGLNCSNSEAFGRVTAEYMMAGLLVLASDTGANTELVQDGLTGILYQKSDTNFLVDKLLWIKSNRKQCKAIASNGCVYAKDNYSIEVNTVKFYEYYRTLMEE